MNRFYLYGASGHGKVVAEIAELSGLDIAGFIDDNHEITELISYPVAHQLPSKPISLLLSIGNNRTRKKIAQSLTQVSYKSLIHPRAIVSRHALLKEGTVVMGGVTINAGSNIGKHCIINTNASIDHDCVIGDYVHISPNAALAGDVKVGEGTQIGIGACVIQSVRIGAWCTIGAGAVIIKDVPDGTTVVGNPGRAIKRKP